MEFDLRGQVTKVGEQMSVDKKGVEKRRHIVVIAGEEYIAELDKLVEFQLTLRSKEPLEGFAPKRWFKIVVRSADAQLQVE